MRTVSLFVLFGVFSTFALASGSEAQLVLRCQLASQHDAGVVLSVYQNPESGPIAEGEGSGFAVVSVDSQGFIKPYRIPVHSNFNTGHDLNIFAIVEESGSDFLLQGDRMPVKALRYKSRLRLNGDLYQLVCTHA